MTTSDDHMKLSDDDNDCRRSSFDRAIYSEEFISPGFGC